MKHFPMLFFVLNLVVLDGFGQTEVQILSKRKTNEIFRTFKDSRYTEYDMYHKIFSKKDSVDFEQSNFVIIYYYRDSLIIALDDYKTKAHKIEVAMKFFESKEFFDIKYFVILFGDLKIEEDEKGNLIFKKLTTRIGFAKK